MITSNDLPAAVITGDKVALNTLTRDHFVGLESYVRELIQQELARGVDANNPYLPPVEQIEGEE